MMGSVPSSSFRRSRAGGGGVSDTGSRTGTQAGWVMAGYISQWGGRFGRNRQRASAWFGAPGAGSAGGGCDMP